MRAIPEITIGVPVYNGENYLGDLLRSIAAQTIQDYRVVITDNASTDRTMEIAQGAAAADARITVHRNPRNIGGNLNFEKVFSYCTTPYFVWLAHDDLIEPTFLETCLEGLRRDPGVVLSGCAAAYVDISGVEIPIDPATGCYDIPYFDTAMAMELAHPAESPDPVARFKDFFPGYFASHIHGLIRSDVIRKTGMLGPHLNGPAIFLAELALRGRFTTCEKRLFKRRYHPKCSEALPWDERVKHTNPDRLPFREAFLHNTRKFSAAILRTETLAVGEKARLIGVVLDNTLREGARGALRRVAAAIGARARVLRAVWHPQS
jgi:glycosyltransferase involved in cell wall biosynthesis